MHYCSAILVGLFYLVIQTQKLSECGEGHIRCLQVSYIKSNKFSFSDIIYGLAGCSPAFSHNSVKVVCLKSSCISCCTDQQFSNQPWLLFDIVIDPLHHESTAASGAIMSWTTFPALFELWHLDSYLSPFLKLYCISVLLVQLHAGVFVICYAFKMCFLIPIRTA